MVDTVHERTALINSVTIRQYGTHVIEIEENSCTSSCRVQKSCSPFNINYSETDDSSSELDNTVTSSEASSRFRYYSRLGFILPGRVCLPKYPTILTINNHELNTQSSVVTIFVIWNTMMGTSLLSMPWAIQQSGFVLGILLMLFVAGLAFYTAYLVLKSTENIPYYLVVPGKILDFTDVCKIYLGRGGAWISILFSSLALMTGLIVYYILLCNFLHSTVNYIYNYFTHHMAASHPVALFNRTLTDVICPMMQSYDTHNASFIPSSNYSIWSKLILSLSVKTNSSTSLFEKLWSQTLTVPFWLLIIIFPLITIKSPAFFTKFNALGTISVIYLFVLVIWKVSIWGIHMDFSSIDYHFRIPNARGSFMVLTGVGSLAFFIHNAIHSIMRNQAEPKNNTRDLLIAYICVAFTYLGIGVLFYIAFPFSKDCIQDNFLNNLTSNDILALIGRFSLFLQILTVFPLLMYILRSQFMYFFYERFYPSCFHVSILHFMLMGICVLFAVFFPRIGEISRISGAVCGLVYVFALPAIVKIQRMRRENHLSIWSLVVHVGLIVFGVLNFCGQFIFYYH